MGTLEGQGAEGGVEHGIGTPPTDWYQCNLGDLGGRTQTLIKHPISKLLYTTVSSFLIAVIPKTIQIFQLLL